VKEGSDETITIEQKEGLQEDQDKVRQVMHMVIPDGHVDTNNVTLVNNSYSPTKVMLLLSEQS
jgi:hypothetical protein